VDKITGVLIAVILAIVALAIVALFEGWLPL
jgi:hypothetical protein